MSLQDVDETLTTAKVTYGDAGTPTIPFQLSFTSNRPFDDVVASLLQSIQVAGLRVLHEIDPQKALQGIGRSMKAFKLIFFFHPELVVRVLEADWSAMAEAPLKFVVAELPDGGVSVRILDPAAAFGRYGNSKLAALGTELAQQCRQIAAASI